MWDGCRDQIVTCDVGVSLRHIQCSCSNGTSAPQCAYTARVAVLETYVDLLLSEAASVFHLQYIHAVASDPECSWPKV